MPRPAPKPTPTSGRLADAYPDLIRTPPESASEITAALHGLADYIEAMDARTSDMEAALTRAVAPRPDTRATGYRALAVVAVVALLCAAAVLGLDLWLAAR